VFDGTISCLSRIRLDLSPIESHNSLKVGERYHDSLRRLYSKVRHDFPVISADLVFSLAKQAMNDTMVNEELFTTLLVFRTVPRLSIGDHFPSQNERMLSMDNARCEMDAIVYEFR
jgi:hypothetical protein